MTRMTAPAHLTMAGAASYVKHHDRRRYQTTMKPWILKITMNRFDPNETNPDFYAAFSKPLNTELVVALRGILDDVRRSYAEYQPDTDEDMVVIALNKLNERYGTDAVITTPPYDLSISF